MNSRSMSASSAVARTPWEIWNLILALTIAHQLLPGFPDADDAFFDGIELLNVRDEDIALTYRAAERLRGALRCVCRGWKEIAELYPYRLYMGVGDRIDDIVWSPRVHIITPCSSCWRNLDMRRTCNPLNEPILTENGIPITSPARSTVEALFLSGYDLSVVPDPYSFRNLRVLSLSLSMDSDLAGVTINTLSLISQCWPPLTHLKLRIIQSDIIDGYLNQSLYLPYLHTLCLTFTSKRHSPLNLSSPSTITIYPRLSTFSLPRLQILALNGEIHNKEKRVLQEIDALLQNVGRTVTGVAFELSIDDLRRSMRGVPDGFWDWCPHVIDLQLTLPTLLRITPPALPPAGEPESNRNGINIIISEPTQPLNERRIPFLPWLSEFFETAPVLWPSISRFTIPVLWQTLQERLQEVRERGRGNARLLKWLVVFRELLVQVQDKEYVILDREGRGMDSEAFEMFVAWLEDPEKSGDGGRIGEQGESTVTTRDPHTRGDSWVNLWS